MSRIVVSNVRVALVDSFEQSVLKVSEHLEHIVRGERQDLLGHFHLVVGHVVIAFCGPGRGGERSLRGQGRVDVTIVPVETCVRVRRQACRGSVGGTLCHVL